MRVILECLSTLLGIKVMTIQQIRDTNDGSFNSCDIARRALNVCLYKFGGSTNQWLIK